MSFGDDQSRLRVTEVLWIGEYTEFQEFYDPDVSKKIRTVVYRK